MAHLAEVTHDRGFPWDSVSIESRAAGGSYVVTKQPPERDGEFEYRIKSVSEPHERVARETELARE
jgi:hypothetical protein